MNQPVNSIPAPLAQAAAEPRQRPRLMLAVMLLSVFMAVANIFIINVATPSIQRGFTPISTAYSSSFRPTPCPMPWP